MIDSHQHFWYYNPVKDAWITDEMSIIRHDFMPADLWPVLHDNSFSGCVAVQADQSEAETLFLTKMASENTFIKGVVGWIDLQQDNITQRLDYFKQYSCIKGWRHIVQAEPAGFMLRPAFINGISNLAAHGYTYDILVYPHQLPEVIELLDYFPNQPFVIDHAAKPAIRNKEMSEWKIYMKEVARHEQVYCKLSGLLTEANWKHWDKNEIFLYMDVIFEYFGTERILFGSDWPVLLLAGSYSQWLNLVKEYVEPLGEDCARQVFNNNAVKFYNL